jgi:hypothetical protein
VRWNANARSAQARLHRAEIQRFDRVSDRAHQRANLGLDLCRESLKHRNPGIPQTRQPGPQPARLERSPPTLRPTVSPPTELFNDTCRSGGRPQPSSDDQTPNPRTKGGWSDVGGLRPDKTTPGAQPEETETVRSESKKSNVTELGSAPGINCPKDDASESRHIAGPILCGEATAR